MKLNALIGTSKKSVIITGEICEPSVVSGKMQIFIAQDLTLKFLHICLYFSHQKLLFIQKLQQILEQKTGKMNTFF